MTHDQGLILQNISVERGSKTIVRNISATFPRGEITAICGPNGAGKSTLMGAMAGNFAHAGDCTYKGRKPTSEELSFMPQALGLRAQLSVLEVVLLGRLDRLGWTLRPADISAAEAAMVSVGIEDLATRRVDTLSGGQQQLVLLAQRLIRKPEILLLDEPTSALDLRRQLVVLDILKTYARTHNPVVVIIMHDLSLAARYGEYLLLLQDGRCAGSGVPAAILDERTIRSVYGVDAEVLYTSEGIPVIAPLCPSSSMRNFSGVSNERKMA